MPDGPARQTSPGITDHRPGISGHFRTFPGISGHRPGIVGHERIIASRIVRRRSHRPVWPVAGERSRCRIACGRACRGRKEPSPGTASGMVVMCGIARCRIACGIARRPSTSRHIPAPLGDLTSLRCSRSGEPNARRPPCPGPTAACSRRRHRRLTNMYSFVWLWRFTVSQSAARLRRIVGPLCSSATNPRVS